jgi:hypothetical protein
MSSPTVLTKFFGLLAMLFSVADARDARRPAKSCFAVESARRSAIVLALLTGNPQPPLSSAISGLSRPEQREREAMTFTQREV